MKYIYIGNDIVKLSTFTIHLIKGNEYEMVSQSKHDKEVRGVGYFKDEIGNTKLVPMEVMVKV